MGDETSTTTAPGPGVYRGVAMSDYQAWPFASNSQLTNLLRSAAHMKAAREAVWKDTPAKMLGTAIHTRVLEPDQFASRYVTGEQCHALTKGGKGPRCSNAGSWPLTDGTFVCGVHLAEGAQTIGATVLAPEDAAVVNAVGEAVRSHAVAGPMIRACTDFELSIVWDDPVTGVRCKARLDAHAPDLAGGTIPDLKTTQSGEIFDFERAILSWGYHRKAWFYLRGAKEAGLQARHFPLIALEKEPPYAVAIYRVSDAVVGYLEDQMTALLTLYAECERRREWPAYPELVREISVPDWGWKRIDEQTAELEDRIRALSGPAKEKVA